MSNDTTMERRDDKIVFGLLETIGGVLLTICMGLAVWCLNEIHQHSDRITRVEAHQDAISATLAEMKADLKEIKNDLKHRN